MASAQVFRRYHIGIEHAADARPLPPRFRVRVRPRRLAGLVLKELLQFRFDLGVALSRPCVYGVFSRPVGGMAPREDLCVGCLRCSVEHPEVVQIVRNPEREKLGGSSVPPEVVETILYEARTGRVPVRGAGYRGRFGGERWDGMWLDMSEIVRPTRDGIHGREFISTAVEACGVPKAHPNSAAALPDRLRSAAVHAPLRPLRLPPTPHRPPPRTPPRPRR